VPKLMLYVFQTWFEFLLMDSLYKHNTCHVFLSYRVSTLLSCFLFISYLTELHISYIHIIMALKVFSQTATDVWKFGA